MVRIYKGNDVDFADIAEIYVSILSAINLTGFTGKFEFMGVTKTFPKEDIERRTFSFTYSSEETSKFCPGKNFGTFTMFDPLGRKALIEQVCIEVIVGGEYCECPGNKRIFVTMDTIYDYRGLSHKPSINGVTVDGDKTGEEYGLADASMSVLHRKFTDWTANPPDEAGEAIVLLFNSAEKKWVPFRGDVQIGDGKGGEDSAYLHWDSEELRDTAIGSLDASRKGLNSFVLGSQSDKPLQGELTFDDKPTEGSSNPVKSGGVFEAIGEIKDILNGEDIPLHPDGGDSSDDPEPQKSVTEAIEDNAWAISEIERALDFILASEEDSSEDDSGDSES